MMAAPLPPDAPGTHLDDDVAALWREGLDSFDIAAALARAGETLNGRTVTEADACRILARQQGERRAARNSSNSGGADGAR